MAKYLLLFAGQAVNFLIAIVNIRAASRGKMLVTCSTDFVFCAVNFALITQVAKAENVWELLAYASGGAAGSAIAIKMTRAWDRPR